MNRYWPFSAARSSTQSVGFGAVALALVLCGCSTPHGYGGDERAARTPDGSSGVVAGAQVRDGNAATPAMQSQSTYLSLITQMQHEGQYFASLAHLDSYEARFGRSPDSILLRGDAERLTDQPELARRSYEALKETPLSGPGYRGLSLLAGARGDFASAANLLVEALRCDSTDAVALSDLGYARLRLGDLSGARVPLMTAAQLTPANPKVMSNVALYLLLEHDTKQAEAVMKSAGVSDQTRQAIYAQASQLSRSNAGERSQAVAFNTPPAPTAGSEVVTKPNMTRMTDAPSALRIDFALADPQTDNAPTTRAADPVVAAAQR